MSVELPATGWCSFLPRNSGTTRTGIIRIGPIEYEIREVADSGHSVVVNW
jgi:hypothetical protein